MKKIILIVLLALSITGCTNKLQTGGAYSPITTNAAGIIIESTTPEYAFFVTDLSFSTAYSAVDAAFTFEKNNRDMLWKISPNIKHTLDKIRPQAWNVVVRYSAARKVYIANPTPPGLTVLQQILTEVQKLSASAIAALPATSPAK